MPPRRILQDKYFKQAKEEGYLARSAYKLKELQERFRIIRPGDRVLDLGCAPGAWLQVACEIVGPDGMVVGLDLTPVDHRLVPDAYSLVGDANEVDAATLMGESGKPFDVVLSDMAPNTTGHGDDLRSSHLCHRVLELAGQVLRPGGNLAMKILEGAMYNEVLGRTKGMFPDARGFKPRSSREVSREMYIVGTRHRPR